MPTYEYTYDGSYSNLATDSAPSAAIAAFFGFGMMIFYLIFFGVMIVSMWKVFVKAGKPGWAILVPVYGLIVMLQIARLPEWYILLMFVPIVNFFVALYVMIKLAKAYGKSTGFGIGLIVLPFIFYPILAFGKSQYIYSDQSPSESTGDFTQAPVQPVTPNNNPNLETPIISPTVSENTQTPPTQTPIV